MPERDRDQLVGQMLRRVMSDDATPQGQCLDGETMAAWSEGSLQAAEASAVERHVAGCTRCRALMASFIRTTPPQPVAESLWRRWHLGWVVPLATAATAAAIWVALPDNRATQFAPAQETNADVRDERSTEPSAVPPGVSRPPAPARQAAAAELRQDQKAKVAEPVLDEARQRSNETASREFSDVQAPPPAATAARAAGAAAPAATAPSAPPPPPVAERAEADTRKEAAANSALAPLGAQRRAFAANQIDSPDGSSRWRIVNGQQVERSTDGGTSWTAATFTSPDRLTAGASPSATVCWIVGPRGAVYLTTDGTRFVRLPFTEMADLTSVFASDAVTATVSSGDGRSWRTSDQGRTWSVIR